MAITPQFQKLLDECQEMEFSHLRPLMEKMFENSDVALLDFAEKAESNVAQTVFFDAMNEIRKKRSAVEKHFYSEIRRSFSEFPAKPEEPTQDLEAGGGLDALSLVDTEEMETSVATQNATSKLASRIMDRIFALKQRLSVVNGGDSIDEQQIPGGPAWLGAAFQHAVEQLELENKVRVVFIALLDKYVLNQLDTLFDEYNSRLVQAGILPNLRYEVRKQPGSVEIVETTATDESAEETQSSQADAEEAWDEQSSSELGDELFGRICELLSGKQGQGPAGPATTGKVTPIHGKRSTDAALQGGGHPAAGGGGGSVLLGQISSLQSDVQSGTTALSSSEFIENIEIDQNLINRLQSTLAEERDKIFGSVDRRKLPAADTNVIELVGMLFEYMLKEENLPNVVKALLSRLHTPLLKVSVLDRQFFTRAQHPARKLLNDMTSAGIRWVEETQMERGIFPTMKAIVDRVLTEFKEDVSLFDTLVEEFDKSVQGLKHRADLVEQRTTEAANGQERLQAARNQAQKEVGALSKGKPVAPAAREFLQRIWADKLTFILLRNQQGDKSEDWLQAMALAGRISESALQPADDKQRAKRMAALDELQEEIRKATQNLQQADKEKLLLSLFDAQRRLLDESTAASEPQAQAEVAEETPVEEEAQENSKTVSPEQRAMLAKLKDVPFGTWFEFEKPGEPKKRAKLSWRSTVTEKFMFVDPMGVKAAVVSMHELVDCMLNGTVRIVSAEKKPFVDRALNAIHRMLDHGTKEQAQA